MSFTDGTLKLRFSTRDLLIAITCFSAGFAILVLGTRLREFGVDTTIRVWFQLLKLPLFGALVGLGIGYLRHRPFRTALLGVFVAVGFIAAREALLAYFL